MAAVTRWYGPAAGHLSTGQLDWADDDVFASLHTSSYSPNQDTHDFADDLTNELSAQGNYSTGGVEVTNKSRSYDATSNEERWDCDAIVFEDLTPSAAFRYIALRKVRGGASSADELIAYIDLGDDVDPGGNDFTFTPHANGILKMTVASS